ncbi:Sucrase/ferredoxin-like [Geosmithia morbida]|uniref:Altered inheritance of mitochondria protein 32 n=1 Tax=Geosmithia morbida TaxID=1094350 RepID=A0A9P4YQC1_9HYPO|nr:Sucrase/ferredoxin-like [Geosmithia morbida]KAF4120810.1 Sucrase/ferredoxin-like [Geosmithia morbida]
MAASPSRHCSGQTRTTVLLPSPPIAEPRKPPPFPTVPTCPSPTCGCADTPEGLDIDHKSRLNGVMTGYAEHVLVCTGKDDWPSKIEEDDGGDNLAADLKELFGRGGEFANPFHNVSVLNSSFPSSVAPRPEVQNSSAYLLPSFKYVPYLPRVSFDSVRAMAKAYILPRKLHPVHDDLSPVHRDRMLRDDTYASLLPGVTDVDEILVLICGHGGRDTRCSIMGAVLRQEFEEKLASVAGLDVRTGPVKTAASTTQLSTGADKEVEDEEEELGARVGLISHIGGHKFAGNVIIYLPPGLVVDEDGTTHPLAGHGIWYGRVEPKHVEGIIEETILNGNVIEDMFRGASKEVAPPPKEGTSPAPAPKRTRRRLILCTLLVAGTVLYTVGGSSDGSHASTLNDETFVPYKMTSRTALSPSSFVMTVVPQTPNPDPPYLLPGSRRWRHPLWSVEFKQPEVQISRHYTPLPPPLEGSDTAITRGENEVESEGALRFYIRAVGDGEMSRYLNRLRPGNTVHLRGPHVGFDLVRRLGAAKRLVFLAGGTGVVPGMQAARVALDGYDDAVVSLLWAVRQRCEIEMGGGTSSERTTVTKAKRWWWPFGHEAGPTELRGDDDGRNLAPVARQLADMKKRYGDRLSVQIVVDDEKTSFGLEHVQKALLDTAAPDHNHTSASVKAPIKAKPVHPGTDCPLHDQALHNLASEFEAGSSPDCRCDAIHGVSLPGKNLFIISGPDGFVTHYAGEKLWRGGRHTQGPVGGVAGRILEQHPHLQKEWLILKL